MESSTQELVREAVKLAEADDGDGLKRVLDQFLSSPPKPGPCDSPEHIMDLMDPALQAALKNAKVAAATELFTRGCKPYRSE